MENQLKEKLTKLFLILLAAAGICSLVVFIPQVREMIIGFGEKLIGRGLTHEVWHERFTRWEIQFFGIAAILFFFLVKSNFKNESTIGSTNISKLFSWILIFISSVLLVFAAFQSGDIWLDETFSLGLAHHNVKELVFLTAQDVHPPLYYLILKIAMMIFPNSIAAAKIISVVPVVIILVISNLFFQKEFSSWHGILFNLILLSTYFVLEYSIEIRMYSWAMLFCFLCCVSSFYIIKSGATKYFAFYVIFAECGAYCQYWTAFVIAINFVLTSVLSFAKDKKSLKKILLTALAGIIFYLPWASVVLKQVSEVSENYWIGPISIKTFAEYIFTAVPSNGIGKIFMFALMIILIAKLISLVVKNRKDFDSWFLIVCFSTPFLLILAATLISIIIRPLFISRYIVPTIVFEAFFIVVAIKKINIKKNVFFAVLFISLFCVGFSMGKLLKEEKNKSSDYETFTKMMNENLTESTVFLFSENIDTHVPRVLAYLYPNNKIYNYEISELWTSTYFYDRKNLIQSLEGEENLCFVTDKEEPVPIEFGNAKCFIENLGTYENLRFYFLKR